MWALPIPVQWIVTPFGRLHSRAATRIFSVESGVPSVFGGVLSTPDGDESTEIQGPISLKRTDESGSTGRGLDEVALDGEGRTGPAA